MAIRVVDGIDNKYSTLNVKPTLCVFTYLLCLNILSEIYTLNTTRHKMSALISLAAIPAGPTSRRLTRVSAQISGCISDTYNRYTHTYCTTVSGVTFLKSTQMLVLGSKN